MSQLFLAVANGPALALATVSDRAPFAQVRVRVEDDAVFTCEGTAEMLVSGVLQRELRIDEGDLPPAKVARTSQTTARPSASPAAASTAKPEAKPAAQAAVAKAAPAAAAKAAPAAEKLPSAATAPAAAPASAKAAAAPPAAKAAAPAAPKAPAQAPAKAAVPAKAGAAANAKAGSPANAKAAATPEATKKGKEIEVKDPVVKKALPSGLQYEILKAGKGNLAMSGKNVQVRYEGRLARTGQRFDKGVIKFRLGMGEVIRGWDEGVKGMMRGERRRLLIPSRLGYGSRGAPPAIPPNADLLFEVELLDC